jgi:hypothetical protein
MIEGMSRGDFYILCPDNAVTREMDEKRIRWAADAGIPLTGTRFTGS